MSSPGNLSDQVLALPNGAGAVGSGGQTFQANPQTGTGSYAIPIDVPPGHAGIAPALALSYSTHAGNGVAGLGWSLGLAAVERRTDKGLPDYNDDTDLFALQSDELLPTGGDTYAMRIETRFARIRHVKEQGRDFWVVTERDGTRVFYGLEPEHRLHNGPGRIATWYASKKQDVHGNEVIYTYARDATTRDVRLTEVTWGRAFRVTIAYEPRADAIRSVRTGFVHLATHRLEHIDVEVRRTSDNAWHAFKTWKMNYIASVWTGRSLLQSVTISGKDADNNVRTLPALTFGYTEPDAKATKWRTLSGALPSLSLADRRVTLAYQSGSGLPDLLESTDTGLFLRENQGSGTFGPPKRVATPSAFQLDAPGTFLSDMDGDGWADLVVQGGRRVYRPAVGGGFAEPYTYASAPSVDFDAPDVRVVDLDGDGVPDVVRAGVGGWVWWRNLGGGQWSPPQAIRDAPNIQLADPRWKLADLTGDGFPDLVYVERTRLTVYPSLGLGRYEAPITVPIPDLGITFDASRVQFVDIAGSGRADLLLIVQGTVFVSLNQGARFGALTKVATSNPSSHGHVEPVDLYGTGALGLLFTDRGGANWRFLELFPGGNPDLLTTIDNGLGGRTTLTLGTSAAHWARARAAGQRWTTRLPMSQKVVDAVTTKDTVTGNQITVRYEYRDGVYDGEDREFRGFSRVDQIDAEAPAGDPLPLPPVLVRRWYHTGADVDIRREYAPTGLYALDDEVPKLPWALRSLRGLVRREETFAKDGNSAPYLVSETAYRTFPRKHPPGQPSRRSFTPLPLKSRVVYTERSAERRVVETATVYDLHTTAQGYGLPVEVRETGSGRSGSFATAHETQQTETLERVTKTAYVHRNVADGTDWFAPYSPAYVVGKPIFVEKYSGADVLLARERLYYDADYAGSQTSLVRGVLTRRTTLALTEDIVDTAFPSGSGADAALADRGGYTADGTEFYIETERSAYNADGLVIGSLDPRGGETTFAYDSTFGLFPVLAVDPLNHPTTLTRGELPHQVSANVDANGNRTEFTYDPAGLPKTKAVMGKFIAGNWQGDPPSHPTESYAYDFDTVPLRLTSQTRQVRLGATFDVTKYLDGLGRTIQERHTAEVDPDTSETRYRVTGWQIFNHKGLVVRAYQPTFAASLDYSKGSTATASVATTYDPLGRPLRVDHPDGTFETTTYHPWVRVHSDRNDNAAGLTSADARYGTAIRGLRTHLNTPTRTYVDALGRDIAVAEDNGAGVLPTFRVTTYELKAGEFTGTTYDLVLNQALSANYFAMVRGVANATNPGAASSGVRVTKDPNGTGDLDTSGSPNVIRLERGASTDGDWLGTVTIWECLGDALASGFTLAGVKTVSFAAGTADALQTASVGTALGALNQVAAYGGPRGGGASCTSGDDSAWASLSAKWTLSPGAGGGGPTLDGERWAGGGVATAAATFTVYLVQWGAEHQLQTVTVSGNHGGDGLDTTGEWDTTSLGTAVARAQSWVTASGWTKDNGIGDGWNGAVVALGDGVTPDDVVDSVSVGTETAVDKDFAVTVHTHPGFSVQWVKSPDGHSGDTTVTTAVVPIGEDETYDETGNLRSTAGLRAAVHTHSMGATSTAYDQGVLWARAVAADAVVANRKTSGTAFVAVLQAVDTVGVTYPDPGSPNFHVTRSVLDLKDQVVEVWDARGLAFATWQFAYDVAGRRLVSDHLTALGSRFALADAANNPMWARDARGIEVERTFDALNRPQTESTNDGTVKLRRMWTYVPAWDDADPNFATYQAANLYGKVEEERDADGLRFFTYDWRGLVVAANHRFWDVGDWTSSGDAFWTEGSTWDPEIPNTPRTAIVSWLAMPDLADPTTAAMATTYDAAGRPVEVTFPTMDLTTDGPMRTRASYNAAGMLEEVEADDGSGSYTVVMDQTRYDARGKVTSHRQGNGAVTTRTYDPDIERLTGLFVQKPGSPGVRFQDLAYAYDPVGNPVQLTDQLATTAYRANEIIPNTRSYSYDPRYRLIRATGKKHASIVDQYDTPAIPSPDPNDYQPYSFRYSYDPVGNFTTNQEYKSGTNNLNYKADRIDLFNGTNAEAVDDDPELGNWRYDANGNATKTPRHGDIGYTFDNQVRWTDMGGGTTLRYLRHGDQRVLRFVNKSGVRALGVYLGPWEYHRRVGTTAYGKMTLHVQGIGGRVAQVERVISGSDPDSLPIFYVHGDHLGSAQVLTKDDGTLLSQEEFFAYGRASDRRDSRNRYRYIGVERDEDAGWCMTGPRTYDPISGRFLQGDPAAIGAAGASPYTYAADGPLRRADPSGYAPENRAADNAHAATATADSAHASVTKANPPAALSKSKIMHQVRSATRHQARAERRGDAPSDAPWVGGRHPERGTIAISSVGEEVHLVADPNADPRSIGANALERGQIVDPEFRRTATREMRRLMGTEEGRRLASEALASGHHVVVRPLEGVLNSSTEAVDAAGATSGGSDSTISWNLKEDFFLPNITENACLEAGEISTPTLGHEFGHSVHMALGIQKPFNPEYMNDPMHAPEEMATIEHENAIRRELGMGERAAHHGTIFPRKP